MTLLDQLNNRYDMKWTCKEEMYGINLDKPFPTYRAKYKTEKYDMGVEISDFSRNFDHTDYSVVFYYGSSLNGGADGMSVYSDEELIQYLDYRLPIRQNQQIMLDL